MADRRAAANEQRALHGRGLPPPRSRSKMSIKETLTMEDPTGLGPIAQSVAQIADTQLANKAYDDLATGPMQEGGKALTDLIKAFRLTAYVLLYGNAYAHIIRDEFGTPIELLILDPESTWVPVITCRQLPMKAHGLPKQTIILLQITFLEQAQSQQAK